MRTRVKLFSLILRNGTGTFTKAPIAFSTSNNFGNLKRRFVHNAAHESISKSLKTFGQPTAETHPHLLKPGELLPGFEIKEFSKRRNDLAQSILSTHKKKNHAVLIPSSTVQYMSDKIPYFFRQNTDFRYLTGCLEPDCALLMLICPDKPCETTLFVRAKSKHSELWEGPRTGVDDAPNFFGVGQAKLTSNLLSELVMLKKKTDNFLFWYDYTNPINYFVHETVVSFLTEIGIKEFVSVKSKLHELRLIKSQNEQNTLNESAEIASRGIENAMGITKPGLTEHQLFATVDYYCRMNHAEYLAYPPVVASGDNANIIHYINNLQQIKDGDMVLMDAGCELHGYCSDITRTWPANGKFSDPQRTLYEIVLNTQLDLIENCSKRPITLDHLFEEMCNLLGERLKKAHVLTKNSEKLKLSEVAYRLCPHHVGHYLGMDVHDTPTVKRDIPLKDGMLITIEPGIYVKNGCDLTKPEFHSMGIRIEDNVLITNSGAKVISNAVKHPADVEKMCQSHHP